MNNNEDRGPSTPASAPAPHQECDRRAQQLNGRVEDVLADLQREREAHDRTRERLTETLSKGFEQSVELSQVRVELEKARRTPRWTEQNSHYALLVLVIAIVAFSFIVVPAITGGA